jgi:hypothetical protein
MTAHANKNVAAAGRATRRRARGPWCALLVLVTALGPGCGYRLAGHGTGLPEDVRSVSIGTIANRSREYGLEKDLSFALERELYVRRQYQVDEVPGSGDAVLTGTIRDVRVRPIAFDANDFAVRYEVVLFLDMALTRQRDGQVLWRVSGLREDEEYSAVAQVEVTSSPDFQRGTLDAKNINDPEFSYIQFAESERRRALARMLNQAARDVYNQMVENF